MLESTSTRGDRRGRVAVGALLAFFLGMGGWFIAESSATFDEPIHYYAGYAYLERGDFAVSFEIPPLSKQLSALPLFLLAKLHLVAPPRFRTLGETASAMDPPATLPPESDPALLALGRLPMLLLGAVTVLLVARWTSRLWGTGAAVVATGLAVTEPTLIAHSGVIKGDIALTCFLFGLFFALWAYREHGGVAAVVCAGVMLGAALGTKQTALIAFPAIALIALFDRDPAWVLPWRRGLPPAHRRHRVVEIGTLLLLLTAVAALVLVVLYAGHGVHFWTDGLSHQIEVGTRGQPSFLLGRHSTNGWWYYFPVAFALKTPTLTLAVIVASLVFWRREQRLRRPEALFLLIPPALVLAAMSWSRIDIGVRYLLPAYPFLLVLAARVATFRPRPLVGVLLAAVLAWNAGQTVRLAPHFLAAGNVIAGGPMGIARALSDSNVDWGQGLAGLRRYMDREGIPGLYLSYFGTVPPSDYGIRYQYLPAFGSEDTGYVLPRSARPLLAISVTNLYGVYLADQDLYAWLRTEEPIATIGYAIYVYDLSRDPRLYCRLAETYERYGESRYAALERARCPR